MSVLTNPSDGAKEQAAAYINAVLEMLGDRDPMGVLASTFGQVEKRARDFDEKILARPEASGKWSAIEVLQHLADSELVWAWRMRLVLAEDRPQLTGYDQDAWALNLKYDRARWYEALEQFKILRKGNLGLLQGLDEEQLRRVGIHVERGEESVEYMIRLYAGHDLVHIRQLERVLETVRETAGQ